MNDSSPARCSIQAGVGLSGIGPPMARSWEVTGWKLPFLGREFPQTSYNRNRESPAAQRIWAFTLGILVRKISLV